MTKKIVLLGGPADGLELAEPPGLSLRVPIVVDGDMPATTVLGAWIYKRHMDGRFRYSGREDYRAPAHGH